MKLVFVSYGSVAIFYFLFFAWFAVMHMEAKL